MKPTDVIDCRQGTYIDPTGRVVRDTHAIGVATVAEVLIKSSNIGMTQIGWKMGIPTLFEGITRFGFGKRTGVELPGDQGGVVKPLAHNGCFNPAGTRCWRSSRSEAPSWRSQSRK